jgi:Tol biopolymer transport system component
MGICKSCGKVNPEDFAFCAYCGTRADDKNESRKSRLVLRPRPAHPSIAWDLLMKIVEDEATNRNRRCCGVASFAWTPDGRALVFASSSDFWSIGFSLWRIASAGAKIPERLVFAGEDNRSPVISRQGHRLVYVQRLTQENIWRVEVPSPRKASRPVSFIPTTRNDAKPDCSPDGKKIAFASDRSGSYQIWVRDSDGSNTMPSTSFDGPVNASPRWSPDGERIAFNSNKGGQYEVYIVKANGGEPLRLTAPPSANSVPNWSRDGKWIYFTSNRTGENQIWKMPADGGEAIRVTQDGGVEAFESPDGTSVYYTKEGDKTRDVGSLWKVPVGGGKEVQVVETVVT